MPAPVDKNLRSTLLWNANYKYMQVIKQHECVLHLISNTFSATHGENRLGVTQARPPPRSPGRSMCMRPGFHGGDSQGQTLEEISALTERTPIHCYGLAEAQAE